MGIGNDSWLNLDLPVPPPKELSIFESMVGEKHIAPSTHGDLHFHIRGNDSSICYDLARAITEVLEPVAISSDEVHGFRYWDGRSIIGFVDGTENPREEEHVNFNPTLIF